MANIPLQSITFPGLSDKYTTPTVDATLTQTGAAADAKKTGDEIAELKNDLNQFPNGTYPNMSVGNADQLTATVGIEDNTPYLFRTSGGSNDIGDREEVRKIVGGTVAWNQLCNNAQSITYNAGEQKDTSVCTFDAVLGHKYLFSAKQSATLTSNERNTGIVRWADNTRYYENANVSANLNAGTRVFITTCTATGSALFSVWVHTPSADVTYSEFQITDITQDFGTTIADYVYSLETATAGAGVAWLKKHFPAQFDSGYQAYDVGSLQSVSGLTAHKMIGFNAYDNTTGKANVVGGNVYQITGTYTGLSIDGEAVTPDASGYFTPAISGELTVTGGNSTNTCVHLVWDGERDGEYEPYVEYTYPLDDSLTLRGIPKLDSNNQLYYDGDEYLPDGTVNRRYGVVDLGTLTWEAISGYAGFFKAETTEIINTPNGIIANALCPKYVTVKGNELSTKDKAISVGMNNAYQIQISDSAHSASSASDFKTAMSGVMLLYEKRLPTTETALPYQETQVVDDFGTEEFVLADGAFPVPVGHYTMYQNNLRAKLEMSPDSPDGDGLYVVQQENGQNEYVPLASTSTIQDILARLTALENA